MRNKRLVPDKEAALNRLFSGYRTYRKNTEWELSRDQFHVLITADCHYCGTPRSNLHVEKWKTKERRGEIRFQFRYNGLDRKDNTKGYVQGNVVTCCIRCNKAKGESSYQEFIAYLKCVVENYPILTLV